MLAIKPLILRGTLNRLRATGPVHWQQVSGAGLPLRLRGAALGALAPSSLSWPAAGMGTQFSLFGPAGSAHCSEDLQFHLSSANTAESEDAKLQCGEEKSVWRGA